MRNPGTYLVLLANINLNIIIGSIAFNCITYIFLYKICHLVVVLAINSGL